MHRHQKPHTRGAASNHNNNNETTSPPSMKRHPFHRHAPFSTSSTPTNKTTPPPPPPPTSTARKGSTIKSPRAPVYHHRKSASAHQFHHRNTSHQSLAKLLGAGSGPASHSVNPEDEQLEMATSFLQYCAMCEKQITVPSNSVLYCSESCRRKDSCKPLSASSYTYTITPPPSPINTYTNMESSSSSTTFPSKPIAVIHHNLPLGRIPSDLHDSKSDLDPTEWKPIISGRHGRNGSLTSLASSDAWIYLSQFHYHREDSRISSSTPSSHVMPFRRQPTTRDSTTSLSAMGTSSLVNTPSLTPASSSVASSPPSSSGDYISATTTTTKSYSYGGAYAYAADSVAAAAIIDPGRPLPPRHNPSFSSAGATKGVELVVPHIITSAEEDGHAHTHEGLWMKA
ncbi:hypothetical protein TMatcc_005685 [Talaromyces marneffei ATCC 18224]|uniref:Life-span regulatory factor domain-containing protein n=3 Tax=Talaromyces marneffei TaxID=37727 RepID=B6Q9B9_TALMQ|nr:conserved hypothetical protein [Talaromyces marneffei ATCC 18224]